MLNPFRRFLSWLYAHPDDVVKARIEQLLQAAAFVYAYRPGVATKLCVLHAAGLDADGLARVATLEMVLLAPENEAAAQHALVVADLQRRDIGLISLTDAINTASAQGRLVLNLFASLAEFERELIRERTLAGLTPAARARGRVGGRKPCLSEEAQRTARAAGLLYKARALSVDDMAQSLRICKATFYKYLHHRGMALYAQPLPSPVVVPST